MSSSRSRPRARPTPKRPRPGRNVALPQVWDIECGIAPMPQCGSTAPCRRPRQSARSAPRGRNRLSPSLPFRHAGAGQTGPKDEAARLVSDCNVALPHIGSMGRTHGGVRSGIGVGAAAVPAVDARSRGFAWPQCDLVALRPGAQPLCDFVATGSERPARERCGTQCGIATTPHSRNVAIATTPPREAKRAPSAPASSSQCGFVALQSGRQSLCHFVAKESRRGADRVVADRCHIVTTSHSGNAAIAASLARSGGTRRLRRAELRGLVVNVALPQTCITG